MATKDLSGQQVGMSPSSPLNNPRPNNQRGRNVFPQSYKHLTTDQYGKYSPFFWVKCERGDVQNLMTKHDLHTFTMKSPMVSDVTMTKSFVKVPMQAIYPRNWEIMMPIPTQGDDVPFDTRALLNVRSLIDYCLSIIVNGGYYESIPALLLLESISSSGSLFARFNIHFNHIYRIGVNGDVISGTIDDLLDNYFFPLILDFARTHGIYNNDDSVVVVGSPDPDSTNVYVSERRFLEILRDSIGFTSFTDSWEDFSFELESMELASGYLSSNVDVDNPEYLINIEPIIAYQLSCAQFATNDFVDFIYSAKLFRDNLESIILPELGIYSFMYNGTTRLYDVFSKYVFDYLIASDSSAILLFFGNLFSYVNSLRYGDYFTGAKPQPLAVGEYSAEVVNNSVSAVDITKSIQMQRLLNRVNMVGRKLGDYLAGIFGGQLPPADKDVPVFLAHQKFRLDGFETSNTGAEQFADGVANTITSHLRSTDSKVAFEIQIDEPCYIIGMNSYESMRIYSRTIDRFAFHHDRYDDFIPEQQYIGDQDIKSVELDSTFSMNPFGYCLRYMEYKQRYSYASGGFIKYLPSWAFITDNSDGNPADYSINPDYIRSSPSEFDRFYKALSGYSLGSYFHFIIVHENITEPIRQMEYTPEILK